MATSAELESAILRLLDERGPGKTICPSEAARAVGHAEWKPLMEPARAAASRLVEAGKIDVTQKGHVIDLAHVKGPIRLRLR
jgi:hypothetical protein